MKLFKLFSLGLLAMPLLISLPSVASPRASLEMIERLGEEVQSLRNDVALRDRQVLLTVKDGNSKLTSAGVLLKVAQENLSRPQVKVFSLPVSIAAMQKNPVVQVKLDGANLSDLSLGNKSPIPTGGASMVMIYDGDVTLVKQILQALPGPYLSN
ncbi:MAG: hypothetical protein KDK66_09255 [Deltaproteobacteria bacterium]|nr:hypothetical protein [Deltaproteobacteria bacterium]